MKELSVEAVQLLNFLLPGFVARWVFHGLTAFKRFDNFERVVEALIFTAIVQAVLNPFRDILLSLGERIDPEAQYLLTWNEDYLLSYSIAISVLVGLLAAGLANNDIIHRWLRNRRFWLTRHENAESWSWHEWRWTKRTATPSQWYGVFSKYPTWVVLNLSEKYANRRLYGWASEWPDHPDDGHFAITHAHWLVGNEQHPATNTQAILVSVKDVLYIEFVSCEQPTSPNSLSIKLGQVRAFFFGWSKNGNQKPGLPTDRQQSTTGTTTGTTTTTSTNNSAATSDGFID